jgi:calcineurin-like phosphoesterase family protein
MSKRFIIADPHFGHSAILKYCNRPFTTVDEMTRVMSKFWNDKVSDNDEVIVIGDVCFSKDPYYITNLMNSLNGRKILVYGNHDKTLKKNSNRLFGFESKQDYLETTIFDGEKDRQLCIFHYPIADWNGRYHGSWHAHGHSHNNMSPIMHKMTPGSWDCGVDVPGNDYAPIEFSELAEKFKTTYKIHEELNGR